MTISTASGATATSTSNAVRLQVHAMSANSGDAASSAKAPFQSVARSLSAYSRGDIDCTLHCSSVDIT